MKWQLSRESTTSVNWKSAHWLFPPRCSPITAHLQRSSTYYNKKITVNFKIFRMALKIKKKSETLIFKIWRAFNFTILKSGNDFLSKNLFKIKSRVNFNNNKKYYLLYFMKTSFSERTFGQLEFERKIKISNWLWPASESVDGRFSSASLAVSTFPRNVSIQFLLRFQKIKSYSC